MPTDGKLLPYDLGVTLPDWQRYTYPPFRRMSRHFKLTRSNRDELIELTAFLMLIPPSWARFAFHWDANGYAEGKKVLKIYEKYAVEYHEANLRAMNVEAGLAIYRALREGGWKHFGLPPQLQTMIMAMRDQGMKVYEIAEELGITRDQAAWYFRSGPATNAQSRIGLAL